jgi:hypothetical protein
MSGASSGTKPSSLDDRSTVEWAQFVAILSAAATLVWMLARITTQLEGIQSVLSPLVQQVNGYGERITRIEAQK